MTRTDALVALVKDHTMARHARSHPDCPVCQEMRRDDDVPEWVRRARAGTLPAKELSGGRLW